MRLKLSYPLFLLAFALLLSAANVGKKPEEPRLNQTEPKTYPNQEKQKSGNEPPSVKPVGAKTTELVGQNSGQKPQESWYDFLWQSNMTNWVAILGWGIASFVAWRTLRSLNEQLRANIVAAEAAKRSADIADRSIRILERAWLDIEIKPREFENGITKVTIFIYNRGRTPAKVKQTIVAEPLFDNCPIGYPNLNPWGQCLLFPQSQLPST